MSTPSAKLSVLVCKDFACVKIAGRANFMSSPDFKTLLTELNQKGYQRFIIDLAECVLMDSTFLGVLAGFALELRKCTPKGSLVLTRMGQRNLELIRNLGLHKLLTVDMSDAGANADACRTALETGVHGELENARLVLEAHENLVSADEANRGKFQDVLVFMKNRVEQG